MAKHLVKGFEIDPFIVINFIVKSRIYQTYFGLNFEIRRLLSLEDANVVLNTNKTKKKLVLITKSNASKEIFYFRLKE